MNNLATISDTKLAYAILCQVIDGNMNTEYFKILQAEGLRRLKSKQ